MPHVRTETVYFYDELSDDAKAKARDWYREGGLDYEWWSHDDAIECASRLGISIAERTETFYPFNSQELKSRQIPEIYFSGFWSQGDGASFAGTYYPKPDALKAITEYAPTDAKLHDIATRLEAALAKCHGVLESITITQRGNSVHEYSMEFEFQWTDDDEAAKAEEGVEDEFIEAFRDFARWIYRQLESEYEHLNSDETVAETIKANEYEFNEDGSRA